MMVCFRARGKSLKIKAHPGAMPVDGCACETPPCLPQTRPILLRFRGSLGNDCLNAASETPVREKGAGDAGAMQAAMEQPVAA
jgi:hypothetical protein